MREYPLVSVAIATHNNLDDIYDGLQSIFDQDYPEIEIVLNDDASEDFYEKEAGLRKYIEDNRTGNVKNVDIHHLEENVGTSKNFNDAIRRCRGKYLRVLSPGDSIYDSHVITKCVDYCEKHSAKILIGQTFMYRKKGGGLDEVKNSALYRFRSRSGRMCQVTPTDRDLNYMMGLPKAECNKIIASRPVISTVSVFYAMKLLRQTNGFPETYRLIEDVPYWPYLAMHKVKFHFAPIRMTKYSLGGVSSGGVGNDEFWHDFTKIMNEDYIAHEYKGGIFNSMLKKLRSREIDYRRIRRYDSSVKTKLKYWDAYLYDKYKNARYLFLGTRL